MALSNAERQARWRARHPKAPRNDVTEPDNAVPSSLDVIAVASRLSNGTATPAELAEAERLLMLFVHYLPAAA